jgi:LuxR family maltose regulon positive regulatory protein
MIVQALALDALGSESSALETLKSAIEMAQPGGSVRTFTDFGPALCQLLSRLAGSGLLTQPGAVQYVNKLLATFPITPNASPVGSPSMLRSDLIEPLTRREAEVLELLAMGLSNKKIADTLVISPFTVRRHVENVSDKIGVRGRFAVVERARRLGLIAPSSP